MRMCRLYLGGPGVGWTFFRIYYNSVRALFNFLASCTADETAMN